jgi:hypothetical protein
VGCNLKAGLHRFKLIDSNTMQTYALAYAMMHGRDTGTTLDTEAREAWPIVAAWGRSLRCTSAELVEAIAQIISQDQDPEEPKSPKYKPMSAGAISAYLAAATGIRAEEWERQVSIGYVATMFNAVIQQAGASGERAMEPASVSANRAFGWYCERIRKRGKTNG